MYELNNEMFGDFKKITNYKLKNGEHRFRILPPFAPNRLNAFVRLHWGFSNENNKMMPIRCLAGKKSGAEAICPICKKHKEMLTNAENLLAQGKMKEGMEAKEEAGKISAKATYIWQILTEEGQHQTLSLSYRAHEALNQKVGFWFQKKGINVTNPERNYKIYCNRTGQKAQTNYSFEVLDGAHDIRKIDVPELYDLYDIHKMKTFNELLEILSLGYVPSSKKKKEAQQEQPKNTEKINTPDNNVQNPTEPLGQMTQQHTEAQMGSASYGQVEPNVGFANFSADDIPF